MSSPFKRSLFTEMPPSIVITEPVPRWWVWGQRLLKVGGLLLLSAGSFYAGVEYQRQQPGSVLARTATMTQQAPDLVPSAPVAAPPEGVAPAPDALLAPRSLEGLRIASLEIRREPGVPQQLRYEFVVANEGRPYEGGFEFLVLGEQAGSPTQWTFPAQEQRARGPFRMRVARYLKTGGVIPLPAGLVPRAVVLTLQEPAGMRAARGITLEEASPLAQAGR